MVNNWENGDEQESRFLLFLIMAGGLLLAGGIKNEFSAINTIAVVDLDRLYKTSDAARKGLLQIQDLTAQQEALVRLGVSPDRIYLDKGLTGSNRQRPGLDQALAAVRSGDTLVVPKLDRLARSVPDAREIADALQARGVKLALGASLYDPADPMGKMFFNVLATFAEFEGDLIRLRTREGMAIARTKGKLRGKQPKLSEKQQKELCRMRETGQYSISDLAELFAISRPTVYRTLSRNNKE
ncbi:recombinase family protein [Morganella morganii]|uniref:recombinase family protein n=1 Tax=Morganella morganii TaxID=582 RepID=UPI002064920D|nr:DNA invertase [Morganella morganii]